MRRLTILLAALGALLLVPAAAAQAKAGLGTTTVEIGGAGNGSVTGNGGNLFLTTEFGSPAFETSPPIECAYKSPGPATGVCSAESGELFEFAEGSFLVAHAAKGSEFAGWTLGAGTVRSDIRLCRETAGPETAAEEGFEEESPGSLQGGQPCQATPENEEWFLEKPTNLKVAFQPCAEASIEIGSGIPSCEGFTGGPTNRALLTLTKSAGGTGGIGSVTSKAKGVNCASTCNEAAASMYKNTPVVLTAKASTGSTFVKWENAKEGGACDGSASTTCTVPMAEAESVEAVFGGVSKEILNPQALTLSKGESSGQGTVKATGLTCELDCSSETALYQGPTGVGPKAKPGKTVVLKALAAYGSTLSGWTGCESNPTPSECSVTMEEAAEVTAEFAAKPTATLTVDKLGTGVGTVTSKPKAISCASTCTTQDATVPTGEAVILKEKPATGMTFEGWTGACVGAGETCTVSLSEAGTVHAKFGGSPKPIANAQELTLTKAGSGYGTIKATGLTCEVLCTSTVSLYQGPTGVGPKAKPGKTVILKALAAPGSKQVEWSGCLSEPTPTECSVVMEEAEEVTATFDEIE
ncbi:MAG TPA: hypothetical protein VFJ64_08740 [Solirubrobacterales bacterium]|nr:hypothetical protein [Solirubrobacterales bacterium]